MVLHSVEQEDGEVPQELNGDACGRQQITREYMLAIRTHASNIREPIDVAGDDSMYVHGMRKVIFEDPSVLVCDGKRIVLNMHAPGRWSRILTSIPWPAHRVLAPSLTQVRLQVVSHIGWNLCRTPVCNVHLPIVPASITMDDCILVLQAMRFEVGVPANEADRIVPEGDKVGWEPLYVLVRRAHQVRDRVTEEVPVLELPMGVASPEALAAALAESAQQAISITKAAGAPYRIGGGNGSRPPLKGRRRGGKEEGEEEEQEYDIMDTDEQEQQQQQAVQGKLSVYTVGTLNTRQMFLVPCSARRVPLEPLSPAPCEG